MSGTLHGAGGIGGLLACDDDGSDYWYLYDGNGNVGQVADGSDYSIDAYYEYDPYGKEMVATGDYAANNPFRFSTKWLDDELSESEQTGAIAENGLYYYGYRYYTPTLGRWLNRDPIAEEGGLNLYAYAYNSPVSLLDFLGQCGACGWIQTNMEANIISVTQSGFTCAFVSEKELREKFMDEATKGWPKTQTMECSEGSCTELVWFTMITVPSNPMTETVTKSGCTVTFTFTVKFRFDGEVGVCK